MRSRSRIIFWAFGLLLSTAACQTSKSSNPTAPTVAGPIPGVTISQPVMLQPAQGWKFKDSEQPILLVVQNATSNGVRPLTYTFEVATASDFANKVFSRSNVAPGDGKTSVQVDHLDNGKAYYWRAWAQDGANTGTPATAGFEIYPPAAVNPPAPVSPVNNAVAASLTPAIVVGNAAIVGPVGPLAYEFQVASDQAFTKLISAGIIAEGSGQTTFNSSPLTAAATMYWRARAGDGQTTSAWSGTQVFRTPAPAPAPSPSPSPTPGAACVSKDPLTIVTCERNKYGHMTATDEVNFLKGLARSLTSNAIPNAPFGILRKSGGTSCNGYSCDIICTGQGQSQKQWDVLGDADPWPNGGVQSPSWNGPSTYPNIRMDVCEIQ
ncbi:MAG TPA: hypothetical protein VEL79_02495 [Vicinamibacterales bacterium]|nr:hypothetical protein [Vicinamibacterales bacterium]